VVPATVPAKLTVNVAVTLFGGFTQLPEARSHLTTGIGVLVELAGVVAGLGGDAGRGVER